MNQKLKIALIRRRSSEQGFAMPIVIALGLVLLLVGATMIATANNDQVKTSQQKKTSQARSVAEAGVAEVLNFLNYKTNRVLATYNLSNWNNSIITNATPPGAPSCGVSGPSLSQFVAASGQGQFVQINSNQDRYKILNYTYNNAANSVPGNATLLIKGESNFAAGNSINTTSSILKVNINVNSDSTTVPGLWLQNVSQNMGNNKIDGNIVVSKCPSDLPIGVGSANVTAGHTATASDVPFPDTPPLPTSNLIEVVQSDLWGHILPRPSDTSPTDKKQPDGSYAYLVKGDLDVTGGPSITIEAGKKVVLYVQGKTVHLGGGPHLNQSGTPEQLQIYGNSFIRDSNNYIVRETSGVSIGAPKTKYGCYVPMTATIASNTIDGSTYIGQCPTLTLDINGNGDIKGLVHLPDATGSVAGGGSSPTFTGAVWIRKWDHQSNNAGPFITASGNYGSFLAIQLNHPPTISASNNWQTCSAASSTDCQQ